MGIAMLAAARLVQAMPQRLEAWIEEWSPRRLATRLRRRRPARRPASATVRPLRVLRVLEPQQARNAAGRMVISGRMADVCAELDRLAAAEAEAPRH
ncbi:hypothetical protein [Pseudorhodoferax sp.]|uniref:hypothetical protein n=1 Tax=Pseudorhodoferax sp. TaxID=1993553 RepID=UPI0039E5EA16